MQTLKTPLTVALKTYLRNHFAALSGLSDWKIPTRPEVLLWAQTSDEGQAKIAAKHINEAGIAEASVSRNAEDTRIFIVCCKKINAETLFRTEFAEFEREIASVSSLEEISDIRRVSGKKDPIQKISHSLFIRIDPMMAGQTMVLYHSTHPSYTAVKIKTFLPEHRSSDPNLPHWCISLKLHDGTQAHYLIRNHRLSSLIKACTEHPLALNMAEFILSKGFATAVAELSLQSKTYWDKEWDAEKDTVDYYETINDSLIQDAFMNRVIPLAQALKEKEERIKILDAGAGKGRLAHKLISTMDTLEIPYTYIFLEPSICQIEIARRKLASARGEIIFIPAAFNTHSFTDTEKMHCIISSGGPINMNIVKRPEAVQNAQKMGNLLLDDGILIATGLTAIMVKRKHFGLEALSYSSPCIIPQEFTTKPFFQSVRQRGTFFNQLQRYVLKKTSPVSDAASSKDTPESGAASMKSGVV